MATPKWDESLHPRAGAGSSGSRGGEFIGKGGTSPNWGRPTPVWKVSAAGDDADMPDRSNAKTWTKTASPKMLEQVSGTLKSRGLKVSDELATLPVAVLKTTRASRGNPEQFHAMEAMSLASLQDGPAKGTTLEAALAEQVKTRGNIKVMYVTMGGDMENTDIAVMSVPQQKAFLVNTGYRGIKLLETLTQQVKDGDTVPGNWSYEIQAPLKHSVDTGNLTEAASMHIQLIALRALVQMTDKLSGGALHNSWLVVMDQQLKSEGLQQNWEGAKKWLGDNVNNLEPNDTSSAMAEMAVKYLAEGKKLPGLFQTWGDAAIGGAK